MLAASGAICVAVLVVLGARVRSMVGPLGVDLWVSHHLIAPLSNRSAHAAGYDWIARVGAPGVVGALTLLTATWGVRRRDALGVLLAIASPVLALLVAEDLLKPLVGRRMSGEGSAFVFPSGTVTVVTASVVATVVLAYRWDGRARVLIAAVVLGIIPLGVAAVVVALDWHYATDAIGGLALGTATVLALTSVLAALEHGIPTRASNGRRKLERV